MAAAAVASVTVRPCSGDSIGIWSSNADSSISARALRPGVCTITCSGKGLLEVVVQVSTVVPVLLVIPAVGAVAFLRDSSRSGSRTTIRTLLQ